MFEKASRSQQQRFSCLRKLPALGSKDSHAWKSVPLSATKILMLAKASCPRQQGFSN